MLNTYSSFNNKYLVKREMSKKQQQSRAASNYSPHGGSEFGESQDEETREALRKQADLKKKAEQVNKEMEQI